jgi:arsenate reductase-like glutaredoxin family protein
VTLAFYLSLNCSVISGDGSNQNEIQEMALTLSGIPNCDTVKKARTWLTEQGIDYVFHDYKKEGIGRQLINLTKEKVGNQSMVLLLSVPTAMEYYPKVGFKKQESSFIMDREEWRQIE